MSNVPSRGCAIAIVFLGLVPLLAVSPAETLVHSRASSSDRSHSSSPPPDSILLGVVWRPPDAPGPALRQLNRIHALGATAVRLTALPPADTIFARADSLGLRLFVDLPVAHVPASALRDTLAQLRPTLDRLRTLARRHASVQYVGLARHTDTTVPAACSVLAEWTRRLHSAPASLRTYYVTPFPPAVDRCAGATDLALLDTRGRAHPVERWRNGTTDTTQTGFGTLGTWVRPGAASGLRVPHSSERQARYLERALSRLLDSFRTTPEVLFAYRWQDRASPLPFRRYGLHDASGTPRPAADVVEGFYTDTQHVFAFPSGTAPPSAPHGLVLLGWGLLFLLAGLYARSPFVRQTIFRYFVTHGFYRDAVRKGRNVGPVVNTTLLLLAVTALGLVAALLTRIAASGPTTGHVVAALPSAVRTPLATGLARTGLTGVVVGGLVLALLLAWTLGLVLAAPRNTNFSLSQGLMLVVWPCWPVLVGLIVALVTATHPPVSPSLLGTLLFWGGLGTTLPVTIRVLRDYWIVTRVPFYRLLGLAVLSPFVLLLLTFTGLAMRYDLPLSFLWHLILQT